MKIKELLSDKSKWIQHTYAVEIIGGHVNPHSDKAVAFCLLGALARCYGGSNEYMEVKARIVKKVGWYISLWNDDENRIFEEVKALVEELDI